MVLKENQKSLKRENLPTISRSMAVEEAAIAIEEASFLHGRCLGTIVHDCDLKEMKNRKGKKDFLLKILENSGEDELSRV